MDSGCQWGENEDCSKSLNLPKMNFERLKAFRQEAYELLGKAQGATMDLMDAVLVTRSVYSFAELSISPVFRRKWASLYEALEDVRPQRRGLMKLYIKQMPKQQRLILAGDHTSWTRLYAETLKDRTYEHGAKVISGKPITLGQGYSTLAWIPEESGSWALPLRHERITSFENPLSKAAFQLRQACQQLEVRPLSLWDSEYGCASFLKLTADIEADKMMRLRPNRCLWAAPPTYEKKGRPRKHGDKFKLSEPDTWSIPVETIEIDDPVWGKIEIKHWTGLHFQETADIPMDIVLIQRKGKNLNADAAKAIWLACLIEEMPLLAEIWPLYQRRFAIDHWNRFAKQRLHWTLPKLSTPQQGQRWSDLMPLLTWQLWLARERVQDNPLPWQKSQAMGQLTPGRVAQSFPAVLVAIGSPAPEPKPRGKSSGWPKGKKRQQKIRYPVVKKRYSPPPKPKKQAS
jgi:hypothetical protein